MKQPKRVTALKSVAIKTSIKTTGGSMAGDYKSNAPGAMKPATPAQTLVAVAVELARLATLEGSGDEFLSAVTASVGHTNDWLTENGYETAHAAEAVGSPVKQQEAL